MNLVVLTPHFEPDIAPTATVTSRIVAELAERGHHLEVVTSLPWYRSHRIEPGYEGKLVRREDTPWGRITRLHPFPSPDKTNIARRAAAFVGFSTLVARAGRRGGPADGVLAVSPPLTLGLAGYSVARARRAPLVFNVQDVYPAVAVELGVITNRRLISAAERLERLCYRRADAITVLSEELRDHVVARTDDSSKVRVIPNFVDTNSIAPAPRINAYRSEFGLGDETVVMYAGNVGLSQSLELVLQAAKEMADRPDVMFVINGEGAARARLEKQAHGLQNVRFVDMQPAHRLPEVLSAGDIHLVPLRRGLARSSVPSKAFSILAAGRPVVACVDPGSEIARIVERSGGGIAVPPDEAPPFVAAIRRLVDNPDEARAMGKAGRSFVESWASPASVAESYERLFTELALSRSARLRRGSISKSDPPGADSGVIS